MKLSSFTYNNESGWSLPELPAMDSPDTLILLFGGSAMEHNEQAFRELTNHYPTSLIMGCSTAGEIFDTLVSDNSLSVAVAQFEKTELRLAIAESPAVQGSESSGAQLASELADPELRAVFVLSDGIEINGSELIKGITDNLGDDVVVTGGLAGDGETFEKTWVVGNRECRSGIVTAIGFYGDAVRISHGSQGGWDIFGPDRRVTRSEGNVLYELDGKPALDLYKSYLGELAGGLPATALLFPLAVEVDKGSEERVVRTVLGVDESNQSMTFAGDIPQGSLAQFMRANFDRLIDGAEDAAQMASQSQQEPVLSIAISCVGRRLVLGERTEEELEAVADRLPAGSHQVGFYSYGEISPGSKGFCDLHNQTMTLTLINES